MLTNVTTGKCTISRADILEAMRLMGYDREAVGGTELPDDEATELIALMAEINALVQAQLAYGAVSDWPTVSKYYHALRGRLFDDRCPCGEQDCPDAGGI
jgi:hypothetical protein